MRRCRSYDVIGQVELQQEIGGPDRNDVAGKAITKHGSCRDVVR